jgi:hypothetical protein
MIEAEAPSTEEATLVHRGGARPPGIVMLAPPEVLRNAERAQSEGRAPGGVSSKRGQGQYKGWGPTPSFAAARESCPLRGLLQRCYMSLYRG